VIWSSAEAAGCFPGGGLSHPLAEATWSAAVAAGCFPGGGLCQLLAEVTWSAALATDFFPGGRLSHPEGPKVEYTDLSGNVLFSFDFS